MPFYRSLLATTVLTVLVTTPPVQAQALAPAMTFDLPAAALTDTLSRFARQAGLQLLSAPELLQEHRSHAVSGAYTPQTALALLLRDSGLTGRIDNRTLLVERASTLSVGSLAEVRVVDRAEREDPRGATTGFTALISAAGTKTDTPILEIPQSISVVTAAQIEAQQAGSLTDALAYTAGVARLEGSSRTTDSMVIRGFQAGADTGALYRDGSKFMVNSYDGQQELYGLERVEVLKGATSLLYGTAAPGGVINTVTKKPVREPLHELGVEIGNHDRRQIKADFGGALNEEKTLSYRLTGLVRDSNTFIDYVPDDRRFLQGAIKWQPNSNTSLTLQADYLHNRTNYAYALPTEGTILPNVNGRIGSNFYNGLPGFDKYVGTNTSLGYLLEHRFNDTLKLRHSVHAFRSRVDLPSSYGDGLSDDQTSTTERGAQDRKDFSRAYTTDTSLEARLVTGRIVHTVLAGVDTTYQYHTTRRYNRDVDVQLNYFQPNYGYALGAPEFFSYYPDNSSNNTGIYLQDQMKIDQHWLVLLGGRYDRATTRLMPVDGVTDNSKQTISANTGRAGVVYLFDNGVAPFASFSQSFQPTSGSDRFGTQLKPTRGEQYEAGMRWQPPGTETLLSAAVFQLTQQNVLAIDPANTFFQTQTGEVRSRGLELEARSRVGRSAQVIIAYGYTDARTTADTVSSTVGQRRGAVPRNTVSIWGDYDFGTLGIPGFKIGLGVRYVGSTLGLFVDGMVRSYTVADAMLSYQTGPWRFALNINNMTDKSYVASCTYGCFFGERRKAVASAIYRW